MDRKLALQERILDDSQARRRFFQVNFDRFMERSVQFAIITIFVIVVCAGLSLGQYVLAPVTAGLLVGMTLGPFSGRLENIGVPSPVASLIIVLTMFAVVTAILFALALPLERWSTRLPEIGERISQKWESIREPIEKLKGVEKSVEKATGGSETTMEVTVKQKGIVSTVISSAGDVIARLFLFLGTIYFFLATRTGVRRACLRLCPSTSSKLSASRIFRDSEAYLSQYVGTITAINIAFGFAVGIVMFMIGLPQPYLWGVLAGVLNFALYVGPLVMAIIMLGVGLTEFPNSTLALAPMLSYLAMNLIEGQFVTPSVLGDRLSLNPLAVFVAISFWLWLWGPLGAFIAVPILIVVTMTLYHIVPMLDPSYRRKLAEQRGRQP